MMMVGRFLFSPHVGTMMAEIFYVDEETSSEESGDDENDMAGFMNLMNLLTV